MINWIGSLNMVEIALLLALGIALIIISLNKLVD